MIQFRMYQGLASKIPSPRPPSPVATTPRAPNPPGTAPAVSPRSKTTMSSGRINAAAVSLLDRAAPTPAAISSSHRLSRVTHQRPTANMASAEYPATATSTDWPAVTK